VVGKKSLKIPKSGVIEGQYNTMAKRKVKRINNDSNEDRQYIEQKKKSKGLTMIYKTIHRTGA
jgi:hypothetical protein